MVGDERDATGHAKDEDGTLTDAILALRRAARSLDNALHEAARLARRDGVPARRDGGSNGLAA